MFCIPLIKQCPSLHYWLAFFFNWLATTVLTFNIPWDCAANRRRTIINGAKLICICFIIVFNLKTLSPTQWPMVKFSLFIVSLFCEVLYVVPWYHVFFYSNVLKNLFNLFTTGFILQTIILCCMATYKLALSCLRSVYERSSSCLLNQSSYFKQEKKAGKRMLRHWGCSYYVNKHQLVPLLGEKPHSMFKRFVK